MPKIYEYLGMLFYIFTRGEEDHPVHVHIKYAGTQSRVIIGYVSGKLSEIKFHRVKGYKQLPESKQKDAVDFIKKHHKDITEKWVQVFVKHMKPKFERITKKV